MSYPILYQAGETNFNHLGLGILKDTISAVVSEDLNGKFELDLVYAYNNKLSKSLLSGNIIKVDAGNVLKEQLFTIAQVSKTLDGKISVHAEHVSYIMQDLTLKPKTVVYQQDAQNALKQLLSAIKETDHGFTVVSDISTISSSTWSVPDFKTPRDVLAGVDGSVLDNWGGEYRFDNRRISLLKQRGSYANTVIAYGRNLLDFEQETSILETYTSIYPVVVKTEKDAEVTHTLPELAVDSQYLDKYANRRTLLVDFSDKFGDKNPYSDDKLRVLANAYIKANKVGIPKVTMTIKTLDLAKMITNDYNASRVERLDLADTVKVYFDRLGITTEAKVVGVKWNVLKESYDEYVLGERKATFGTVIRGSIAEVKAVADDAKKDAITALVSADGKNTNYYGNSSDGAPTNPKKGDIWFVKDGDKTIIKTWNGSSWVDLVSSDWQEIFNAKLTEELTKSKVELDAALLEKDKALAGLDKKIADELVVIDTSVKKAQADANTATTRANNAVDKANASVTAIEANTQLINDVNAIANTAKSQAQTADTNAQTALTSANTAMTNARNAINQVTQLNSDLEDTNGQISTITDNLNGFKQTVYTKTQTDTKIATVQSDVNGFKTSVSNTYATKSEIQGIKAGVRNYICEVAWTTKGYLATNGSVTNSNDNLVSSFIDVDASKAWIFQQFESATSGSVYVAFYDTNKKLVGSRVTLADGQTGTTASNVTYMRLSTPYKDTFGGRYKFEFGTVKSDWTQAPEDTQFIYINLQTQVDQTANAVSAKADKTTVDQISGRVDTAEGSITTMAGQIKLKANKTDVDTVKGRVTSAEGSISLISGQVALKANQADVNTTNGKVSSLESSFTVQSGQISALNTKTDGQTTQIGSLQSSYDGLTSTVASTVTGITNNSLISTQMISSTTLKHPNYPDMPMVEVPVTNGESYTVTTNQPWEDNAAHVFYLRETSTIPNSSTNGVYDGKSITLPALSEKIYIVFRNQDFLNRFINGQYWVKVEVTPASKIQVSKLSQDLSGFKTTVANTYADKSTVASQINQSATAVTQDVQSWTNGKLNSYSTIQSTDSSIASAVSSKADKTQITQLSNQITSTVTGLTDDSMITVDMIKDANTKHPDYPDMIVLGIPATIGETYTVSTNKPNRGTESAPIADVFYTQALDAPPSSLSNGAWSGHSVTTKAVINRIYLVFRDANFLNSFANGEYWVKVIAAPASQSQITQLVNDINLRVTKDSVVNQINISPESILIAGNKIQITGQTYIENGVIENAKIKDLSASKLTAGTIDASLINVTKINASNITTGTLSADRIAANSITATHISISSLSALSANLGIITAGTINAATVNIININAASITTGTLNADRIGANSITADKIKATSLDLFSNDSYTNVRSDGMRIQSKAHIIFGPWIDVNGNRRSTQGIYIGGFGGGTKHVALTRSNGTTFLLRAEDGMDYGANKNVSIGDLNLYDSVQFWESARVHGNLINEGYIAMGGGIQEASIQYEKSAGTMNFRVPGARSGSYFWFNQRAISEGSFDSKSKLSLKNVKGRYEGNALREIVNTDIVEYSYKNDPKRRQLSPIIDDINKIKKYKLPDIINDGESVNLYAMNSMSWLAIKQLAKKLENIEEKLDAIA